MEFISNYTSTINRQKFIKLIQFFDNKNLAFNLNEITFNISFIHRIYTLLLDPSIAELGSTIHNDKAWLQYGEAKLQII